jgi:hypothetical protein
MGVLCESLIHPITIISTLPSAGIGALLLPMAVHIDLSVIAIVVPHPAHPDRQEKRHHSGRLRPAGRTQPRLAGPGLDLSGLRPALPTDPDEHDGSIAWRRADDGGHGSRLGDSPAARLR